MASAISEGIQEGWECGFGSNVIEDWRASCRQNKSMGKSLSGRLPTILEPLLVKVMDLARTGCSFPHKMMRPSTALWFASHGAGKVRWLTTSAHGKNLLLISSADTGSRKRDSGPQVTANRIELHDWTGFLEGTPDR